MFDGTLVYPKQGWEPPPVPAGYRRKSNDLHSPDAWAFEPVLPACNLRTREISFTPCGAAKVVYFCRLEGQKTRVTNACLECPHAVR